jgi:hypothetical protein
LSCVVEILREVQVGPDNSVKNRVSIYSKVGPIHPFSSLADAFLQGVMREQLRSDGQYHQPARQLTYKLRRRKNWEAMALLDFSGISETSNDFAEIPPCEQESLP